MNKPTYAVSSMAEINAIPWNGFNVVSTFSGCGGSCLGYRMAGFRVLWANEFVPAAQDSYKANAAPCSHLDARDIRQVQPEEILEQVGLKIGEVDLLDGSPPCQAFSTAGKRETGWGKEKTYEHGAKQCNETLFDEYIRILMGLMPKVFIAENVSGLVKGTAKGYFKEILAGLKASGYNVKAQLLDAQWLGVPQMRQRIIFQGVRNDLGLEPAFPKPLSYRYSVREALPWIGRAIHDTGGTNPKRWAANIDISNRSCPSITNGISGMNSCHFKIEGANGFNGHEGRTVDSPACTIQAGRQIQMIIGNNHFESIWGNIDNLNPTIMAGGANKQAGFLRMGLERRKFTIAELRRICAFPDDFVLTGSYAQQWERLGNSVPPLMMKAIAEVVRDKILVS